MSDRVIRFGGSSIANTRSIINLKTYLEQSVQRTFIVISAVPELLSLVEDTISGIFSVSLQPDELEKRIISFFRESTCSQPTRHYLELSTQLVNLLKGISLIGDYSPALYDQVVSFSEKLTAEIFLWQWEASGGKAKLFLPENMALKVTSDYGNATYLSVDENTITLNEREVAIVPGSFGIDKFGKIARTGKTAADYTAAALTAFLGAEKLELWALDDQFRKADPELVENPPVIERLTYAEASELAYFEHYSFHPRTVEPLEDKHIPIYVLNPETGHGRVETVINTEAFVDEKIVKSVACTDDISLLKLDGPGVGLAPGILAKVTSRLNDSGINIKSVITSQTSINLILGRSSADRSLKLVKKLGYTSVQEIKLIKDVSLIGIIGHGMQQNYGISARIFNAVAENRINVILSGSGASDLVSYLIVGSSYKAKSVRVIYNAFFKSEK
ncbi:MAG: hypothetical protein CR996_00260 [Draconibacterium sp.]|nr:MAG: hypothetical protein CR996_00260 [Draconibacterium sp.]PIF06463.1 MAG: hypothetical protein CSA36_01440 [Draconibacterium sp.]